MVRVNIEDVQEIIRKRKRINKIPFDQIRWYKDGKVLFVPFSIASDFKYTGLNNTDFVATGAYKKKRSLWKKDSQDIGT